jgi:hypothetical protein
MGIATVATVSVISALIGAVVGAYLQRRWTPDYSKKLDDLQEQVAALEVQKERMEQERAEAEQLRLNMSLRHGYVRNYVVLFENDSDREITIEKVGLRRDDVWLCEMCVPKVESGLMVGPRSGKQICFEPQHDPTMTLQNMEPELQPGRCIEVELVLDYRLFGRPRQFRKKILATADYRNRTLTQFSP